MRRQPSEGVIPLCPLSISSTPDSSTPVFFLHKIIKFVQNINYFLGNVSIGETWKIMFGNVF